MRVKQNPSALKFYKLFFMFYANDKWMFDSGRNKKWETLLDKTVRL